MNLVTIDFIKLTLGVLATIGLYSVLYQETKIYRFFEHVFLGLAAGYALVAVWTETLYVNWWSRMFGSFAEDGTTMAEPGRWAYAILLPIGLMAYFVFSKKNNWMSRIPIGIILGMWAGQQVFIWWNTYGPQINATMQPLVPTTWDTWFVPYTVGMEPAQVAEVRANIHLSQAITNFIFLLTFLSAFSYFLFSFELKGKFLLGFNRMGRWFLMIGFGAIFGSTVMARFALAIDRLSFIFIEWAQAASRLFG
jgi:hypothetical protein